jgi:hypothetical protein
MLLLLMLLLLMCSPDWVSVEVPGEVTFVAGSHLERTQGGHLSLTVPDSADPAPPGAQRLTVSNGSGINVESEQVTHETSWKSPGER